VHSRTDTGEAGTDNQHIEVLIGHRLVLFLFLVRTDDYRLPAKPHGWLVQNGKLIGI
tara:strand:- start:477 stop:647 length:171 start_codon:yes stop_codon:yes gene_type:complete